jgi:hypothetical protein
MSVRRKVRTTENNNMDIKTLLYRDKHEHVHNENTGHLMYISSGDTLTLQSTSNFGHTIIFHRIVLCYLAVFSRPEIHVFNCQ